MASATELTVRRGRSRQPVALRAPRESVIVTAAQRRAAVVTALDDVAPEVADAFVRTVTRGEHDGREPDSGMWGEEPTAPDLAAVAFHSLLQDFKLREQLDEQSLSVEQAGRLLQVSPQSIRAMLTKRRSLIGFKSGGSWRLPAWQFSVETETGHLPGLTELQEEFPSGIVSLSRWVTTPSPEFPAERGGEVVHFAPRDALLQGRLVEVLRAARQLHAAAW